MKYIRQDNTLAIRVLQELGAKLQAVTVSMTYEKAFDRYETYERDFYIVKGSVFDYMSDRNFHKFLRKYKLDFDSQVAGFGWSVVEYGLPRDIEECLYDDALHNIKVDLCK